MSWCENDVIAWIRICMDLKGKLDTYIRANSFSWDSSDMIRRVTWPDDISIPGNFYLSPGKKFSGLKFASVSCLKGSAGTGRQMTSSRKCDTIRSIMCLTCWVAIRMSPLKTRPRRHSVNIPIFDHSPPITGTILLILWRDSLLPSHRGAVVALWEIIASIYSSMFPCPSQWDTVLWVRNTCTKKINCMVGRVG